MINRRILFVLIAGSLVTACDPLVPAGAALGYRLPVVPDGWSAVLGPPQWRLEWRDADGRRQWRQGTEPSGSLDLDRTRAGAVLAYPYWPEAGILAGEVRPAGGIFPFDVADDTLVLSWLGGVAAGFFRELAAAAGDVQTVPERFDWPRFRAALTADSLPATVRADPWLVDWRSVAQRTRAAGFDRRRLVPQATEPLTLRVPRPGPWVSDSPFYAVADWTEGAYTDLELTTSGNTYFCPQGRWRCGREASLFSPWP